MIGGCRRFFSTLGDVLEADVSVVERPNRQRDAAVRLVALPRVAKMLAHRVRTKAEPQTDPPDRLALRSEEHTSELQSLMRISYAVFCLKKKKLTKINNQIDIK